MSKGPELYFDAGSNSGSYWLRQGDGRFLRLDGGNTKLHLRAANLPPPPKSALAEFTNTEWAMLCAQRERAVDYAGPLAGYRVGLHQLGPFRALVTSEAATVTPKEGDWEFIEVFLGDLLGDAKAMWRLMAWFKVAIESLRDGDFRPGQMVVFCGPAGCGKSLMLHLIVQALGGRMAKPYQWMTGATAFNGELASSESLVIDDEAASTDIRSRRAFGAALKQLTVGGELHIHAKGRQALSLRTFRRLALATNDEPENLSILPPMDSSISDKAMLFQCHRAEVGDDRDAIRKKLTAALPGFLHACCKLKIPAGKNSLRDSRFGVQAWHDGPLMDSLASLSPEYRLGRLIEDTLFAKAQEPWKGTADQLEKDLQAGPLGFQVERLTKGWHAAVGTYLARLAKGQPARYHSTTVAGKTVWEIQPPAA